MRVCFDSSAFAKRYINEPGTAEVLAWCDRADELVLSVIALPEMISAFCRLLWSSSRLRPAPACGCLGRTLLRLHEVGLAAHAGGDEFGERHDVLA